MPRGSLPQLGRPWCQPCPPAGRWTARGTAPRPPPRSSSPRRWPAASRASSCGLRCCSPATRSTCTCAPTRCPASSATSSGCSSWFPSTPSTPGSASSSWGATSTTSTSTRLCHLQLPEPLLPVPGGRERHHGRDPGKARRVQLPLWHLLPAWPVLLHRLPALLQAGHPAVLRGEASHGPDHHHPAGLRQVQRRGFQHPERLPVHHPRLQRLCQPGPLRPVPFLLRHQGAPAALRACAQVPHHQGHHLPLLLAGTAAGRPGAVWGHPRGPGHRQEQGGRRDTGHRLPELHHLHRDVVRGCGAALRLLLPGVRGEETELASPRGPHAEHLQWPQGDHEPAGHRAGRRPQLLARLPALHTAGHARGPRAQPVRAPLTQRPPWGGRWLRQGQEPQRGEESADPPRGAVVASAGVPEPLTSGKGRDPLTLLPKVKPFPRPSPGAGDPQPTPPRPRAHAPALPAPWAPRVA
ncbi:transmembrane protein 184A isoform X4 [Choloepus didactylus]|uniref:transmembrane protein 184A isoform X4 n=1 Tax=Choloepus didactylus TaxID=27675 RepID=UPI0018A0F220|nr:transmembrane protein 184A isoform X4 [Choloepus didactylus]